MLRRRKASCWSRWARGPPKRLREKAEKLAARRRPGPEIPQCAASHPPEDAAAHLACSRLRARRQCFCSRRAQPAGRLGRRRRSAGQARRLSARPHRAHDANMATAAPSTATTARDASTLRINFDFKIRRRPPQIPRVSSIAPPIWCLSFGGSLSGEHGDGSRAPRCCPKCSGRSWWRPSATFKTALGSGQPHEPRQAHRTRVRVYEPA